MYRHWLWETCLLACFCKPWVKYAAVALGTRDSVLIVHPSGYYIYLRHVAMLTSNLRVAKAKEKGQLTALNPQAVKYTPLFFDEECLLVVWVG